MRRRALAAGAAIVLPAAFVAFHADGAAPPASPRHDADTPIREAHRAYFAARKVEAVICAGPAFPFGSTENLRQEAEQDGAVERMGRALLAVTKAQARTLEGLRLKAQMLAEEVAQSKGLSMGTDSCQLQLAASVAADIARLVPVEGAQA
ncbi:hypothetical protein [Roseomonas marmotae]|uniref:UrcA family protein n=1 Tax=Roseomonas marmotae TaxID=2768161 RepID=A0ABS3K7B8_9PROT|nr:hypothetical protein [Roseomonas marmotae]MBO1073366.1 hypothetical protein [Roseomonas marmotae]